MQSERDNSPWLYREEMREASPIDLFVDDTELEDGRSADEDQFPTQAPCSSNAKKRKLASSIFDDEEIGLDQTETTLLELLRMHRANRQAQIQYDTKYDKLVQSLQRHKN